MEITSSSEPFLQVKMDSIIKLKDSTRKLLCLLEEIQTKTHSNIIIPDDIPNLTDKIKPIQSMCIPTTVSEVIGAGALKKLENQAKTLDAIYIENEDDDCSVYKRLTRKCVCLNQQEYNDFIIHFNEDTKYFTSTVGEIIKNMRILKKFVYMAGSYSKNALMFLNEPIKTKNGSNQIPPAKRTNHAKNKNKSKSLLGVTSKYRQASRRKVTEWESPRAINRSKKFTKKKDSVIVVPVE